MAQQIEEPDTLHETHTIGRKIFLDVLYYHSSWELSSDLNTHNKYQFKILAKKYIYWIFIFPL